MGGLIASFKNTIGYYSASDRQEVESALAQWLDHVLEMGGSVSFGKTVLRLDDTVWVVASDRIEIKNTVYPHVRECISGTTGICIRGRGNYEYRVTLIELLRKHVEGTLGTFIKKHINEIDERHIYADSGRTTPLEDTIKRAYRAGSIEFINERYRETSVRINPDDILELEYIRNTPESDPAWYLRVKNAAGDVVVNERTRGNIHTTLHNVTVHMQ